MDEDFVLTDFKKTFPNDGFQHVQVASTCSQREAPSSAVTLKPTSQTLHQRAKSLAIRTTRPELTRDE